jgi:hypothetical protein
MWQNLYASSYFGHDKFFRGRLLVLDSEQIAAMVEAMEKESNDIKQEAIKMAWYMRGGITYEQALQLNATERKTVSALIKDNLETTKKSGLPFF